MEENKRRRRKARKARKEKERIEQERREGERKDDDISQDKNEETQQSGIEEITNEKPRGSNKHAEDKETNKRRSNEAELSLYYVDDETEHIGKHTETLEKYFSEEHETIASVLIKISLKVLQQWSRKITKAGTERVQSK